MRNNKHHFRHNFAKCFFFNRRVKVGILGGSFDPAHYGHIHLSSIALKKMQLDEIWWLVSPQNRLKKKDIIQSFFSRLNYARKLTVNNKKIKVLDLEYVNKLFSSYNSIKFLKTKSRDTKFIWLMGSDNLLNFNKWLNAKQISKTFPVAVIERPSYSYKAINCLGAKQLGKRIKKVKLSNFNHKFSAWIFIRDKLSNISSTKIRDINTKH
tara:strand:- start:752 stop:1381 length:630 start_codon:yes stop_codon:yes gene_type:complete